jgi:hypothetical protein
MVLLDTNQPATRTGLAAVMAINVKETDLRRVINHNIGLFRVFVETDAGFGPVMVQSWMVERKLRTHDYTVAPNHPTTALTSVKINEKDDNDDDDGGKGGCSSSTDIDVLKVKDSHVTKTTTKNNRRRQGN